LSAAISITTTISREKASFRQWLPLCIQICTTGHDDFVALTTVRSCFQRRVAMKNSADTKVVKVQKTLGKATKIRSSIKAGCARECGPPAPPKLPVHS
jgi:hypothetical protein